MPKRPEGYCLVREYAAARGVSPRYIYRLIGEGRLQPIRFRGRKYLRPDDTIAPTPVAAERERLAAERLLARHVALRSMLVMPTFAGRKRDS
jgi:hypothetical protein